MAANTASAQDFVKQQVEAARAIFVERGLPLRILEETVIEFYLFYFPIADKYSIPGETRRGQTASRLVREELADRQGQEVVDSNDCLIRIACAYATALLLEAYDQVGDTLAQQAEAATLRSSQVTQAKSRVDPTRAKGNFGKAIEAYFAAALRVGRLDVFFVDHEGNLRRESLMDAAYRLAHEAVCAELGEVTERQRQSIGKGLGLAKGLLNEAVRATTPDRQK